uniref:Uncharacterized protein n=1 Tax=Amphimedon queenslandica TaxID=400682 RepID=A0A1X7T8F4_AMPQE
MEREENLTYDNLMCDTIEEEPVYELCQSPAVKARRPEQSKNLKQKKNKKQTTWNKPIFILIVLLSLMVILQISILCLLLVNMSTRDTTNTDATTGAISGNIGSPNFIEWANVVASKVNSNVTQSLPDFTEWANGVG